MKNIKLPIATSIVVDDVGWFDGRDLRVSGGPARSGLPRFHHPDDVRALNEIGRALNTKILCSLVLGDWDKCNRLRGVPHVTAEEDGWDRAASIDLDYANSYFDALEESEFLDYAIHGLMHSYYEDGKLVTARQYYPDRTDGHGNKTGGYRWLSTEEFDRMIGLFLEIYRDWGFKKPIVDFVSPCGCFGAVKDKGNIRYAEVLRKYGVLHWANGWKNNEYQVDTVEGIIISGAYGTVIPWNAYGANPKYFGDVKVGTHLCGHLANFVRYDPEDNFEYVEAWADYFRRMTSPFGLMLARDKGESCSQTLYSRFARVSASEGGYVIDLDGLDAVDAIDKRMEFFVSLRGVTPTGCIGGSLTLREQRADHAIYKIVRDGGARVEIRV